MQRRSSEWTTRDRASRRALCWLLESQDIYFYFEGERMNECYSSSIGIMESLEACPPKCSGKFLAQTIRSRSSLPEAKATLALVASDRKGLTMLHSVKKTLGALQKIAVVTRSG